MRSGLDRYTDSVRTQRKYTCVPRYRTTTRGTSVWRIHTRACLPASQAPRTKPVFTEHRPHLHGRNHGPRVSPRAPQISLNAQPVNFLHSAACARARPQQFSWAHVLSSFCSADEMEISRGQNRIGETRLQPELEQHSAFSTQEEGKLRARGGHRHEHPRMGLVLGGPMSTNSTEQSQHNTTQPQYGTRTSCSAAHFRRRCACAAPQSQNTRNDNIDSTSRFTGQYLARLRRTTYYLQLAACSRPPQFTCAAAAYTRTTVYVCVLTARALAAGSSSTSQ